MIKSRKGQSSTMTLEELIKLILGFFVFMFIAMFLVTLYLAFTTSTPSTYETDFLRVKKDIEAYNINVDNIKIPVFSKDIVFSMDKIGNTPMKGCGVEKFCLCYWKGANTGKPNECTELEIKIEEASVVINNNIFLGANINFLTLKLTSDKKIVLI